MQLHQMLIKKVIPNREGINRSLNLTQMIDHHVFYTTTIFDLNIKLRKKKYPPD